jgi:hypothetical protein
MKIASQDLCPGTGLQVYEEINGAESPDSNSMNGTWRRRSCMDDAWWRLRRWAAADSRFAVPQQLITVASLMMLSA